MWKLLIVWILTLAAASPFAGADDSVQELTREARAMAQLAESSATAGLPSSSFAALVALRQRQDDNRVREIVIVSILTLLSQAMVLVALRYHARTSPTLLVNATSLIFIVSGTVILTLMVDTEAQLTAATGILGAVAGYMFGSMRKGSSGDGTTERS